MIQVQGVYKRFGGVQALQDVSFEIRKGEVVGFLGANGAGKTTMLDIICGCLGADRGSVKIGEYDILHSPRELKRMIGYLPDVSPLHNEMFVGEYLRYAASLKGLRGRNLIEACQRETGRLFLDDVKKRLIGNLSKGYRRRVGLAQALVHSPEVLILDEPTDGLDPLQIAQIRELVRSLRVEGRTVVFSSHILSEVESICDQIIIMDRGHVVERGTYQSVMAQFESSVLYHLRVDKKVEACLEQLKCIRGVVYARVLDESKQLLELGIVDQGVIDPMVRIVLEGGFGLRELTPKFKTLEDAYFRCTAFQETVNVDPAIPAR